jgi:diacylglycerol kinase (ATP)
LTGGSAEESLKLAQAAIREGAEALVACGGDGTLHLALQAVAETDTPLGLIPVGTGNDNARTLNIPRNDPAAAADVIADGRTTLIDCGHVAAGDGVGRYFLGVMSIGFDSEVTERANGMSWPPGQAKYLVATIAELSVFKPIPFSITVDGQNCDQTAMLIAVGNGVSYGGGMKVCPSAVQTDGELDMTVLGAVSKLKFIRSFPSVFKGTHIEEDFVVERRFKEAVLAAEGQIAYADGERVGPSPATVTIRPGAVNFYVPTN